MQRLIVRGFANGKLLFAERVDVSSPAEVGPMATRHVKTLQPYDDMMVEFEFIDRPMHERFLRFGTDPRLMVMPIRTNLSDGTQ